MKSAARLFWSVLAWAIALAFLLLFLLTDTTALDRAFTR